MLVGLMWMASRLVPRCLDVAGMDVLSKNLVSLAQQVLHSWYTHASSVSWFSSDGLHVRGQSFL